MKIAVCLIIVALITSGCGLTISKTRTIDQLNSDILVLKQQLLLCETKSEVDSLNAQILLLQKEIANKKEDKGGLSFGESGVELGGD